MSDTISIMRMIINIENWQGSIALMRGCQRAAGALQRTGTQEAA